MTQNPLIQFQLATGVPRPFPRLNGYLIVPNEKGAVVGIITWLGIEESGYPKLRRVHDNELIDLPFPKRKLTLIPIGNMTLEECKGKSGLSFNLERGVSIYPSVGDAVVLPTKDELACIVEGRDENARLEIGIAPLAGGVHVSVDPDKLFGRHLAILGNTGSGKSCSVAGLIRWSLEAAHNDIAIKYQMHVLLYWIPMGNIQKHLMMLKNTLIAECLDLAAGTQRSLKLSAPHWAWSTEEWSGILRTGPGFQAPILRRSLQQLKDWSGNGKLTEGHKIVSALSTRFMWIDSLIKSGPEKYGEFPGTKTVTNILTTDIKWFEKNYDQDTVPKELGDVSELIELMEEVRDSSMDSGYQNPYDVNKLDELKEKILEVLGPFKDKLPKIEGSPDRPFPFSIDNLATTVEMEADRQGGDVAHYTRTMLLRLNRFQEDADISSAIDSMGSENLETVLSRTFGAEFESNPESNVTVLDLSFVPKDVLHIVITVLARIIFETLQWFRKINDNSKVLPTVLVLEEAHTFVQRSILGGQDELSPAVMCRSTFERIAREGRKFGLGLVLSSQRPSEISPTVLAQCNTFLLHRIVNDRDQDLVSRLVPESLGGLFRELPNLPTRQAILLGWATPLPVLIEMLELEKNQRPQSDDPDFWNIWTHQELRPVEWDKISDNWQGKKMKTKRVLKRRRLKPIKKE